MTTISKLALINGAYSLMRISGLTVEPSANDISDALNVADDYAAQLKAEKGIDIGWQYPATYGMSSPADTSGLTREIAGAFKKCLCVELLSYFGKPLTVELNKIHSEGMRAIEHYFVSVPDAEYPMTLPLGSGSEYNYADRRFYAPPANNNDADYVYQDNVLNFEYDFSGWLVDETLLTATWTVESKDSAITIDNETISSPVASAELTFNELGGYAICITATKSNSTDVLTVKKNFIIRECD